MPRQTTWEEERFVVEISAHALALCSCWRTRPWREEGSVCWRRLFTWLQPGSKERRTSGSHSPFCYDLYLKWPTGSCFENLFLEAGSIWGGGSSWQNSFTGKGFGEYSNLTLPVSCSTELWRGIVTWFYHHDDHECCHAFATVVHRSLWATNQNRPFLSKKYLFLSGILVTAIQKQTMYSSRAHPGDLTSSH